MRNQPSIPLFERIKSIPEIFGIRVNEEPRYDVVKKDGTFEIRQYPALLMATVTLDEADFDAFREKAFNILASYIFGENKPKHAAGNQEQMAMTSPVFLEKKSKHSWSMSFVLPSKYKRSTAPAPKDPSVKLQEVKTYYAAVTTYSGNNTLEKIKAHEQELANWIRGQVELQTKGGFCIAQYDAPFVIPFLKKNEVQIEVTYLQ